MIPWLVGAIVVMRRTELAAIPKEPWAPALALVPLDCCCTFRAMWSSRHASGWWVFW